jgi:predicted nucleotidyltransferase
VSDPRRAAIERFTAACAAEPLVAAAFLGGSFVAGTADEFSDLDLYVVTEEADYAAFFAGREEFVRGWGVPVFLDTSIDFEGFGFDLVHFVFADGVSGELACGHRGNLLALHGGPHQVLVDKAGVLEGVTFPGFQPSEAEQRSQVERDLSWFWLGVIDFAKYLARDRRAAAQRLLAGMQNRCESLAEYARSGGDVDSELVARRLLDTHVSAEPEAMAAAARELVAIHRAVGTAAAHAFGLAYPSGLAAVAEETLERGVDACTNVDLGRPRSSRG